MSLPCVNLSGETEVAMLGQNLYIKSRRPGQLTLVWEMGGDKRGGSWECVCWVTEGKGKGKCVCVCVCVSAGKRWGKNVCQCVCFSVFVLYLFVNAHGDTPDPLWQGLCYSTEELC